MIAHEIPETQVREIDSGQMTFSGVSDWESGSAHKDANKAKVEDVGYSRQW